MVAGLSAHEPLRLVRNPRFRPVDGRPDGYPDAITIDCCADRQRAFAPSSKGARTSSAAASACTPSWPPSTRSRRASPDSCTRNADPRHDLRVPEHPHAAVRRRRRAPRRSTTLSIAARSWRSHGRRALRAGHLPVPARRTSPATAPTARIRRDAGGSRPWSAPDLAARPAPDRPVAHARHARDRVRATAQVFLGPGRLLVTLLAPAGIPSHAARAARLVDYFSYIADSRHRAQIGSGGVAPRLPRRVEHAATAPLRRVRPGLSQPEQLLGVLRPPHRRAHAARLPDAGRRRPAATRCGPRPTSASPTEAAVVPLINAKSITFVSRRVGNFQYSQQWGVLYDQLWVR